MLDSKPMVSLWRRRFPWSPRPRMHANLPSPGEVIERTSVSMKFSYLAQGAVAGMLFCATVVPYAAAQQVASSDSTTVKAGTYKVEPYHTQVSFSISHFGFTDFSGFFSGASGTLVLNPAKPSDSKLEVSLPVQSILTTVPILD